ncbi:MAG: DNA repair protein RadA [Nitrosopumilus sp.]|jgi:predicted Zn-ribbon and HTH transcriptional regulator|nr:DNA repair protein RadA [Nitrosopumilus sp.]MDH3825127.1 DNA repair protein RadA [Nitrosopumilus sp.]
MIQLEDLKICDNCGNTFAKILSGKAINRCPACKTWKMGSED